MYNSVAYIWFLVFSWQKYEPWISVTTEDSGCQWGHRGGCSGCPQQKWQWVDNSYLATDFFKLILRCFLLRVVSQRYAYVQEKVFANRSSMFTSVIGLLMLSTGPQCLTVHTEIKINIDIVNHSKLSSSYSVLLRLSSNVYLLWSGINFHDFIVNGL